MAKKKGVVDQIIDAVDHAIHPEKPASEEVSPAKVESIDFKITVEEQESSKENSDYASHPKFAKFNKKGAE